MRDTYPFNSAVIKSLDFLIFLTSFTFILPIEESVFRFNVGEI